MKYLMVFFLLFFIFIINIQTSLSLKEKKVKDGKLGGVEKSVFDKNLVKEDTTTKEILENYKYFCKNELDFRRFKGHVLGYLTPWNKDGYSNSIQFAGKFTMVSPVWLRVINGEINEIVGVDDIERVWIDKMKNNKFTNNTVKIYPRIHFESWSRDVIKEFYINIKMRKTFIREISELAEHFQFDGYVFEIWNEFLSTGIESKLVVSLINDMADALKKKYLDVILVIPPWRGRDNELFTESNFNSLANHIKAFSLMSYDYSDFHRPGPNAPYNWIKKCVEFICPKSDDPRRSKILLGINFYGNFFASEGGGAIIGHQYIKYIKTHKGIIKWNANVKEHFIDIKASEAGQAGYIFYPTLQSIQSRLELAMELNTGISIWEIGQGLNYFFDLF